MRSSEQIIDDVCRVLAGGRCPVLTGNIDDLHIGPTGTVIGFLELLAFAATRDGRTLVRWSPAAGTSQVTPPGTAPVAFAGPGPGPDLPAAFARLTDALARVNRPVMLVIDWTDWALVRPGEPLGAAGEVLCTAVLDPGLNRAGHRVVVVDRAGHAAATLTTRPGFHPVNIPLPNHDERVEFLEFFDDQSRFPEIATRAPGETIGRIADASNGMSLRSLLAVMTELGHQGQQLDSGTLAPVKHDFLVSHTEGALRPMTTSRTLDEVAGVHNLRVLLGDGQQNPAMPSRHIILAGPPGVGKSTVAAAIGATLGLSVVSLGELRAEFVGQSERRTRLMMHAADSMRPLVVFVDEIDQMLSGDDGPTGDSGVTKRINAMLWEWIGEVSSGPGVLLVGATNRPESLGVRVHDRFNVVPILHPDPTEAVDIMRIAAARDGRRLDVAAAAALLGEHPRLHTGRTLAAIVLDASRIGDQQNGTRCEAISNGALRLAIDDVLTWTDDRDQELMALQAIRHTRHKSLLPWVAAASRGVPYQPPSYVTPFLTSDGMFDTTALDARIAHLTR